MTEPVRDQLRRPLESLRLSVTDRCNLRCHYCMPEQSYTWLPRDDILHFEELSALVDAFTDVGVRELHVTGGEPLMRKDVSALVRLLTAKPALTDIALTTNGVVLADHVDELRAAGLRRVTVSLDTLRRERFVAISRRDLLHRVLGGIEAARAAGFTGMGINSVVMRGLNDDEVPDLVEFGRRIGAEVRFIEYMDVGGATRWEADRVVGRDEIVRRVEARLGPVRALPRTDSSPASRFELDDGTRFGVIAPMSAPFCRSCDRARLTSDGHFFTCLYATRGLDLRTPLRAGATRADLAAELARVWSGRADRGAELRAELAQRGPLVDRAALEGDPHLEMHARGG